MALNTMLFNDNKAIAAGLIVADTATGIQKSLAIAPYDYFNVGIIAATGAVNLANALGASKGGGGGSVSTPSGGSGGAINRQDNAVDTSSLELTDQSEGLNQVITVRFETDGGDEFLDAIANGLNDKARTGA